MSAGIFSSRSSGGKPTRIELYTEETHGIVEFGSRSILGLLLLIKMYLKRAKQDVSFAQFDKISNFLY